MAQPGTSSSSDVLTTLDERVPSGILVCFAALAALAIVFVWKFLPETKGLAVEGIVKLFEQHPATETAQAAEGEARR